jgi:hypothetical protein
LSATEASELLNRLGLEELRRVVYGSTDAR